MSRLGSTVLCLALLSACGSQPKVVLPKPVVKSIAIIPAVDPKAYTLENVSALQFLIPLAATANYLDSKEKAKVFDRTLRSTEPALAADLTARIATALTRRGYDVRVLQDVPRSPSDPDDVDYKKLSWNSDALLHLKLPDVGLYSPRSSLNYLPRVNARGALLVKGREDELYDEEIVYGVDARKGSKWSIVVDDSIGYASFDAVIVKIDDVKRIFQTGVAEIGQRMSEQIDESIR